MKNLNIKKITSENGTVFYKTFFKGCNFVSFSEEDLIKTVKESEFKRMTIYTSSVYTYSCRALRLDDGTVELIEYFNNGEKTTTTKFKNEDEFWKIAKL